MLSTICQFSDFVNAQNDRIYGCFDSISYYQPAVYPGRHTTHLQSIGSYFLLDLHEATGVEEGAGKRGAYGAAARIGWIPSQGGMIKEGACLMVTMTLRTMKN